MIDPIIFNASITKSKAIDVYNTEPPNPLRLKANLASYSALLDYSQVLTIPAFDTDSIEIQQKIEKLQVLSPEVLEKGEESNNIISEIEYSSVSGVDNNYSVVFYNKNIPSNYTKFHVISNGIICSVSVVQGNSSKTLLKNPQTGTLTRYLEKRELNNGEFEIIDCKLNPQIQEIKKKTPQTEICIKYENNHKIIDVKRKIPEVN